MLLANILTDLTDWLENVSAEWWFLLVIIALAFLDSVVPLLPSETAVIMGGVAAGSGDQRLVLVIAAGALGAFLGDNTAYLLGRQFASWFEHRAEKNEKTQKRLSWAHEQIKKRGGLLLITARFIPGGRTALTVTSGITEQKWRWFASWDLVAVIIWASYASLLGFVFGKRFENNHTVAFLLAFGAALAITLLIEGGRHLREKSKGGDESGERGQQQEVRADS